MISHQSRMLNYLIYQAYGAGDILNEALFSVLSFLRQEERAATQVIIYTDNSAHFQAVLRDVPGLHYEAVAPAQWREWRGDIDFVHRVKIKVLQHAAANYSGNFLYLDTDTVFQASPTPIFAALATGERFMHVSEGSLGGGNELSRKINRALQQPGAQAALPGGPIAPATTMYNAGALGLRSTDAPLLAEVLRLTEALYRLYPKHVMEQLAFSAVWQRAGGVREAAPWVYHYWDLKEIRPVLGELFAPAHRSLAEWQARAAPLDIAAHGAGKAAFRRHPGWRRALLRGLGRAWQLPPVAFPAQ